METKTQINNLFSNIEAIENANHELQTTNGNGTVNSPYSMYEYLTMVAKGTWQGGYVSGFNEYISSSDTTHWKNTPNSEGYYGYSVNYYASTSNSDYCEVYEFANSWSYLYLNSYNVPTDGWKAQEHRYICVPTVLEYSYRILTGTDNLKRNDFADIYRYLTFEEVYNEGVKPKHFTTLVDYVFNYDKIGLTPKDSIEQDIEHERAIENSIMAKHPVIATINTNLGPHEILLVGFIRKENFETLNHYFDIFIGINPGTGKECYHSFNHILKQYPVFSLKSTKRNTPF